MKGIDPFVAEILLIATVFAVFTIIFISLTGFLESKSEEDIKKAERAKCFSSAKIAITSVTKDTIVILNKGNVELFNISVFVDSIKVGSFEKLNILEAKSINFDRLNNKSVFVSAFCSDISFSTSCKEFDFCWIE
ncbi:MAG: hypothetical protein QW641_02955 [Candidatus Aenigmatarchaeota archaeon]